MNPRCIEVDSGANNWLDCSLDSLADNPLADVEELSLIARYRRQDSMGFYWKIWDKWNGSKCDRGMSFFRKPSSTRCYGFPDMCQKEVVLTV